jgi:hypothetical protein
MYVTSVHGCSTVNLGLKANKSKNQRPGVNTVIVSRYTTALAMRRRRTQGVTENGDRVNILP